MNRGGAAGLVSERESVLNSVRVLFNSSGYGNNTGAKVKVFVFMFTCAGRSLSKHVLSCTFNNHNNRSVPWKDFWGNSCRLSGPRDTLQFVPVLVVVCRWRRGGGVKY